MSSQGNLSTSTISWGRPGENTLEPEDRLVRLIESACQGQQRGWDGLVDRFIPLVQSVIRRYGFQVQDAEDVNQTVWLKLLEHLNGIRNPEALPGWIVTTTRNECVNVIRRSHQSVYIEDWNPHLQMTQAVAPDCIEMISQEERRCALRCGFAELPDIHRSLLLLLIEDPPPSYGEISVRLDMPIGSIGPTRARALDRLRRTRAMTSVGDDASCETTRHPTLKG
jgi:RNA polymerase sigma factor (sigma-70 family)